MIDWDDYRFVLAIARGRGLSPAAETLGVTLSTVFRRLEKIEQALGTRLFERHRGDYSPTDAGAELVDAAERMEQETLSADLAVSGLDKQLSGTLRISSSEVLSACFLARYIPAFQARHPGINVRMLANNRLVSLIDREADVALRPQRPQENTLVGRKFGVLQWGIYGAAAKYNNQQAGYDLKALGRHRFIAWEGNPAADSIMAQLQTVVPELRVSLSSSSLLSNAAMAASGGMLVVLPCMLGAFWPGLNCLHAPLPGIEGEIWAVYHERLRGNARIKALLDWLAESVSDHPHIRLQAIVRSSIRPD